MQRRNRRIIGTDVRRGLNRKKVFVKVVLRCLFLLYRVIVDTFGEMGFVKYFRMKAYRDALIGEVTELKNDNIRLLKEDRTLKDDQSQIETLARDKLGLAHRGEIVYYYVP